MASSKGSGSEKTPSERIGEAIIRHGGTRPAARALAAVSGRETDQERRSLYRWRSGVNPSWGSAAALARAFGGDPSDWRESNENQAKLHSLQRTIHTEVIELAQKLEYLEAKIERLVSLILEAQLPQEASTPPTQEPLTLRQLFEDFPEVRTGEPVNLPRLPDIEPEPGVPLSESAQAEQEEHPRDRARPRSADEPEPARDE